MNENYTYSYEEEPEIDLQDMIFYLLKQWRVLIAAILIGALIGGGIYLMKKNSVDRAAAELTAQMEDAQTVPEDEQTVAELRENYRISEDVETNMELAYQYRQLYRKQLEYNQNSPLMQMNPGAVYAGELEYYVSAGYDTGVTALLYQNILNGSDILAELKEAAALDYQEQYIRELIRCEVTRENDATINVNNGASLVYKNAVVTFTVNAATEEECGQMLQVIREKVAALDQECAETYEEYEMIPVNDSIHLMASSDYLSRQKSNTDQLNTYRNTMTSLENSFTEDELAYYNRVYLSRDYEQEEESGEAISAEPVVEAEPVSLVKWLLIGIFLMCVVWGGYYLVKYLLDKKLKTPDEIRSRYHLPLIGYVKANIEPGKGLDGWLDQMRSKNWGEKAAPENIGTMIDAMGLQHMLLCVQGESRKLVMSAEEICGCTHSLKRADALNKNGSLALKAKESDGVILAVELGGTAYAEIDRELEISRLQGIAVKGVVVVA